MKLGIVGYPLTTTRSPEIHKRFLKMSGLKGTYKKFPFNPVKGKRKFFSFLNSLQKEGVVGVNVTVPLKEWAYEYAKKTQRGIFGKTAEVAKSANTLILDRKIAANTDSRGLWEDLAKNFSYFRNFDLCVVGTGGTARGILAGLTCGEPFSSRCKNVAVLGRDEKKVSNLLKIVRKRKLSRVTSKNCIVVWTLPPLQKTVAKKIWNETVLSEMRRKKYKQFSLYDVNYGERALPTRNFLPNSRRSTGERMLEIQAAYSFYLWLSSAVDKNCHKK